MCAQILPVRSQHHRWHRATTAAVTPGPGGDTATSLCPPALLLLHGGTGPGVQMKAGVVRATSCHPVSPAARDSCWSLPGCSRNWGHWEPLREDWGGVPASPSGLFWLHLLLGGPAQNVVTQLGGSGWPWAPLEPFQQSQGAGKEPCSPSGGSRPEFLLLPGSHSRGWAPDVLVLFSAAAPEP